MTSSARNLASSRAVAASSQSLRISRYSPSGVMAKMMSAMISVPQRLPKASKAIPSMNPPGPSFDGPNTSRSESDPSAATFILETRWPVVSAM